MKTIRDHKIVRFYSKRCIVCIFLIPEPTVWNVNSYFESTSCDTNMQLTTSHVLPVLNFSVPQITNLLHGVCNSEDLSEICWQFPEKTKHNTD